MQTVNVQDVTGANNSNRYVLTDGEILWSYLQKQHNPYPNISLPGRVFCNLYFYRSHVMARCCIPPSTPTRRASVIRSNLLMRNYGNKRFTLHQDGKQVIVSPKRRNIAQKGNLRNVCSTPTRQYSIHSHSH